VPVTGLSPERSEFRTVKGVHDLAAQVTELNVPVVEHVTDPTLEPPIEYPALQVTKTLSLVTPVIEPVEALFELATCEAMHELAAQINVLKAPVVEHVAVPVAERGEEPEMEYPVLHVTVTA